MNPHSQQAKHCHLHLCTEARTCYFFFCFLLLQFVASMKAHAAGSSFKLQPHKLHGLLVRNRYEPVSFALLGGVRRRDEARHSRLLASASADPVDFALGGIADPSLAGLYFTEIAIGTPPTKHYVQVDTGSDLLWVNCASCTTCPTSTHLGVHLTLYDPRSSLTSSRILCGDPYCDMASWGECQTIGLCGYQLGYGDGSLSQGYFVRDSLRLQLGSGNKSNTKNATIVFGCGTSQSGQMHNSDQALDGIMGFGQSNLSVISQLVNQNKASRVFAHCLDGEGEGGGILVIGEVQSSALAYTHILQNQPHYNVNLKSINVNGVVIPIDSSISGTSVDSGTTLAYFLDATYQLLLRAILDAVALHKTTSNSWEGMTCIALVDSVDDVFPSITLNFEGEGAVMVIKPHEYLIRAEGEQGKGWCIGFQITPNNIGQNILGDLVLKDRLVVYDLQQQRIGWTDYDCSTNISVQLTTGHLEHISASPIPILSGVSTSVCHWKFRKNF